MFQIEPQKFYYYCCNFPSEPWCATVYPDYDYGLPEHKLVQADHGTLFETDAEFVGVSSVKVRKGCTLTGYDDRYRENKIFTYSEDTARIDNGNDKMTSYTCKCQGTPSFEIFFIVHKFFF